MIRCVHIDGDSSLLEHSDLTLLESPPFAIPNAEIKWANEQFPDGLSFMGWKCIPTLFEIGRGIINTQDPNLNVCLIEHDFEAIRRLRFPEMPSRLQCFFAAATLGDLFADWPILFKPRATFYEVSCSSSYSMDAAFLNKYSASVECWPDDNASGIESICKYWRRERSSSPQIELLPPLKQGVHIGNSLSIQR